MNSKLKLLMFKTLSRNDTGETHSHQSGISIPKDAAKAEIFPHLGIETLNPRVTIDFYDEDGSRWRFEYIYYNDKFHGKESQRAHNEFRMTRVIDFLRKVDAHSGDKIWFGLDEDGMRHIGVRKMDSSGQHPQVDIEIDKGVSVSSAVDDDSEINDSCILDPNDEVESTVIKLNKDWYKIELK